MDKQIIQDPEEIERFVKLLDEFNKGISDDNRKLKARLRKLGETWRDPQYKKFFLEFEKIIQYMNKFQEINDETVPKLLRLAEKGKKVHH